VKLSLIGIGLINKDSINGLHTISDKGKNSKFTIYTLRYDKC